MASDLPFTAGLRAFPGKAIPGMIKGFHAWRDHARAARKTAQPELPSAMVIAAADLGIDPLALFRAPPGGLYVVRSAAPVVPPFVEGVHDAGLSAAAEFAVTILGVGDIIVLGNRGSALVSALIGHAPRLAAMFGEGERLPLWFALAEAPLAQAMRPQIPDELRPKVLAQEMVRMSIENLMSYPWIAALVMQGVLGLHGWYLDEDARQIFRLDPETDDFVPI